LIESIELAKERDLGRQVRAAHGVYASALQIRALAKLEEALDALSQTSDLAALTPERAVGAREALRSATHRWLSAAFCLRDLPQWLQQLPDLTDPIHAGCRRLPDYNVELPTTRPPSAVRLFLAEEISREATRRFLAGPRRQRFTPSTVADAPRRVSRGRAPPPLSTCPL
jgi:hypothetical protein